MAEKRVWSKEDTMLLITEWESRPELWDLKSKDYKNRVKRQNALKFLATMFLESTESEISRKLHNLRTQFHHEVRKIRKKNSGDSADEVYKSSWEYFDAMKFIQSEHSEPTTTFDNLANKSQRPTQRKNKIQKQNESAADVTLKKAIKIMEKEADEFQIFGDFVASELRNLHSNVLRNQLKRTIQRAIIDASESDDKQQYGTDSSCSKQT